MTRADESGDLAGLTPADGLGDVHASGLVTEEQARLQRMGRRVIHWRNRAIRAEVAIEAAPHTHKCQKKRSWDRQRGDDVACICWKGVWVRPAVVNE